MKEGRPVDVTDQSRKWNFYFECGIGFVVGFNSVTERAVIAGVAVSKQGCLSDLRLRCLGKGWRVLNAFSGAGAYRVQRGNHAPWAKKPWRRWPVVAPVDSEAV